MIESTTNEQKQFAKVIAKKGCDVNSLKFKKSLKSMAYFMKQLSQ